MPSSLPEVTTDRMSYLMLFLALRCSAPHALFREDIWRLQLVHCFKIVSDNRQLLIDLQFVGSVKWINYRLDWFSSYFIHLRILYYFESVMLKVGFRG